MCASCPHYVSITGEKMAKAINKNEVKLQISSVTYLFLISKKKYENGMVLLMSAAFESI